MTVIPIGKIVLEVVGENTHSRYRVVEWRKSWKELVDTFYSIYVVEIHGSEGWVDLNLGEYESIEDAKKDIYLMERETL